MMRRVSSPLLLAVLVSCVSMARAQSLNGTPAVAAALSAVPAGWLVSAAGTQGQGAFCDHGAVPPATRCAD